MADKKAKAGGAGASPGKIPNNFDAAQQAFLSARIQSEMNNQI
jgi:hypothetical protein